MELDPFLALDHVSATPAVREGTTSSIVNNGGIGGGANAHDDDRDRDGEIDPLSGTISSSSSGAAATSANKASSSGKSSETTPEDLNEELATLLLQKQLPQSSVTALQNLLRENASLKEKNQKLKSLLGRSAKAQRDAKNELEAAKKSHESARRDVERLEKRVEVLANRPTHMDLLADFETNFDRALLSVGPESGGGQQHQQSGGEDAAESHSGVELTSSSSLPGHNNDGHSSLYDDPPSRRSGRHSKSNRASSSDPSSHSSSASSGGDSLLLTELNESKSRIAHLESLNSSFQSRHSDLERLHRDSLAERASLKNASANLQLELRMSRMETEHALRSLREREAVAAEMQLEIDLVTRSAVEANRRAAEGNELAERARRDGEYVDGLEAKVVALQEWALASTESKRLTAERCRGLEGRVRELEARAAITTTTTMAEGGAAALSSVAEDGVATDVALSGGAIDQSVGGPLAVSDGISDPSSTSSSNRSGERKLWTRASSLVVGAGMAGHALLELSPDTRIQPHETVMLRWKFDLTPADLDIYFSVLKGAHEDRRAQRGADACFRRRHVKGGGGGDVSGAFAVQNACTLVWSNEMSWVRPRTIKWTVDAVAIEWSD